eukprot:TRINITY_DN2905_c0_g1_i5.p1 TRINITY_DN2905_c0_g1~~TRINITY_DN2905_c0_g1_i5.p1  ORF type:complete len:726 (-),score=170.06 TRINITY_DN2905_c0_g1_i5:204-2381(-)
MLHHGTDSDSPRRGLSVGLGLGLSVGLGADAAWREEALSDLCRQLSQPEHLDRLATLRLEYLRRKESAEVELKTAVQVQLENAHRGLETIHQTKARIDDIERNFVSIQTLYEECEMLLGNYPIVRSVSVTRNNLTRVSNELTKIRNIPRKIEELQKLLADDSQLLDVHMQIRDLELGRSAVVREFSKASGELKFFQEKFAVLDTLKKSMQERIRQILTQAQRHAQETPEPLIQALRVIEADEREDRKKLAIIEGLKKAGKPYDESFKPKRSMENAKEIMEASVQLRFEILTDDLSFQERLMRLDTIIDGLIPIMDDMVPIFPEKYDIYNFHAQLFHTRVFESIAGMVADFSKIKPLEVLMLINWITEYELRCVQILGLEDLQPPLKRNIPVLIDNYCLHLKTILGVWYKNILAQDETAEPFQVEGRLLTYFPSDLFNMLEQQVDLAIKQGNDDLTCAVLLECATVLACFPRDLQALYQSWKDERKSVPLQKVVASINNCDRCFDLTTEFQETYQKYLISAEAKQVDWDAISRGFTDATKVPIQLLSNIICDDLSHTFPLFYSKEWKTEDPMSVVIATLQDYFEELSQLLLAFYMKSLCAICLETVINEILGNLIANQYVQDQESKANTLKDVSKLQVFFSNYLKPRTLEQIMTPYQNLESGFGATYEFLFATCKSTSHDKLRRAYEQLLKSSPKMDSDTPSGVAGGGGIFSKAREEFSGFSAFRR